jgi:hypothetical protein
MTSLHRSLRRVAAAAALSGLAVAAAGCGSSSSQAGQPTGTKTVTAKATPPASTAPATPTSSATPTPTPSGPQPCPASALRAALGSGNGAAGSTYYPLELTNTSGSACTLFGYPGVSFVTGAGGSQIGRAASRNPALSDELVTLAPGAVAHSTLQVVDAANYPPGRCHMVTAHLLKIYPPNQTAPLYLGFTAPACTAQGNGVHILSVQAVRPGSS